MFGTAYFIDGHTESITSYNTNPNGTELYFATCSGMYGYKEYIAPDIPDTVCTKLFKTRCHNFYKYIQQWLIISDIEYIEIYTEVLN